MRGIVLKPHSNTVPMLKHVLKSPTFLGITAAGAVLYYIIIHYIILLSNSGLFFLTVPPYLIYASVLVSAVPLGLAAYAARYSLLRGRIEVGGGILSIGTTLAGALVSSCGCSAPLLGSLLYYVGFNILSVSSVLVSINSYQIYLIALGMAINLFFAYYFINKLSAGCIIKGNRIRRIR